jgi:hypothetical protein
MVDGMTPEPERLPVVDPTTGEVLDGEGQRYGDECPRCEAHARRSDGLAGDVEGLEREARNLRRKIKVLEAELKEQRQEAPESATVRTIFRRWVSVTGRNPKRVKLGEKREKAILARLREGYTPEDLMRAVDALALAPTTSSSETQRQALLLVMRQAVEVLPEEAADKLRATYAQAMKNVVVYDDLELAMRNEVNVERFRGLAERLDPQGGFRPPSDQPAV